jgi:hypothetical protein
MELVQNSIDLEKDKLIKKEFNRLKKIYSDIDSNKYALVEPLIKNAAFMATTMCELEKTISKSGAIVELPDSKGEMKPKRTAEMDTYIALQKNYLATVKQLESLCPLSRKRGKLEEFINDS